MELWHIDNDVDDITAVDEPLVDFIVDNLLATRMSDHVHQAGTVDNGHL